MRLVLALSLAVSALGQASCSAYCTAVLANCMTTNAIYTGSDMTASCMAECAFFPMGDGVNNASATGNTLGCREYHATAAATNAAVHCPHARPDSTICTSMEATAAGLTSGTCDNFCDNVAMTCATAANNLFQGSRAACIRACARYMDQASPSGTYPLPAVTTGDVACRRYHVQAARADATAMALHCPHADLLGGGVCGTPAASFCQQAAGGNMSACTVAQTGYADNAACMAIWANIPLGTAADTSGDTRGCRAYHLSVALQSAAMATTHCPHTGQSGSGACGDTCDAYCSQYASACTGIAGAAAYASTAACRTACTGFSTAMGITGDTLGCRFYHVGVAQGSAALATTHCPHASQTGGGVCVATTPAPAPTSSAASTAISALVVAVPALFAFLRV